MTQLDLGSVREEAPPEDTREAVEPGAEERPLLRLAAEQLLDAGGEAVFQDRFLPVAFRAAISRVRSQSL